MSKKVVEKEIQQVSLSTVSSPLGRPLHAYRRQTCSSRFTIGPVFSFCYHNSAHAPRRTSKRNSAIFLEEWFLPTWWLAQAPNMYQLINSTAPLLSFHDHRATRVHAPRRTLVTFSGTQLLIDGYAGGLLTQPYKELIPKTIGNRKRDCAWGGSGW